MCCGGAPESAARCCAEPAVVPDSMHDADLARRATAEAVGTAFLVAIVVGSGIAAQRLSPDDVGLQLLENSIATGAGLVALILAFGSVSGAHFNPVVTLADRLLGGMPTRDAGVYVVAQVVGACVGAMVANLMFELPAVDVSTNDRVVGRALARRGRRHVRPAARDPRRRARGPGIGRCVRGRRLHRGGVLVHVVDQLRQPRGHRRPDRSPTRSRASRRPAFPASSWRRSSGALLAVALALFLFPERPCRRPRRPARRARLNEGVVMTDTRAHHRPAARAALRRRPARRRVRGHLRRRDHRAVPARRATTSSPTAPRRRTSCPSWPSASPRQRLKALARVEGKARRRAPDRALPVRPQRGALADGARLVRAPRRRPRAWRGRAAPSRAPR